MCFSTMVPSMHSNLMQEVLSTTKYNMRDQTYSGGYINRKIPNLDKNI